MTTATTAAKTDPFDHPALFYRDEHEYLAGTLPFITEGLAAGAPVAVAVPTANLALLREELGRDAEHVRMLDMTEVGRNPGRIIPGVLRAFADAHPGRHVRIIGEPIWAHRSETEYPACAQHEALINHAFTGHTATILCPYDVAALDPLVVADAARTHPVLVDRTGRRDSDQYAPDAVVADYNRPLATPPNAVTFTATATDLARLRRWASATAGALGLSEGRAGDLLLAVTELATNSIEHAGSSATVMLGVDGSDLVCQVHDTGHITDPLVGRRPEAAGQRRGRGLLMVNHLADLVRLHTTPRGTSIEARFVLT
ncbi:sensor histidine kinase [Kutzneria kofuensis]|uniref:Anti-sigma regulatory factor (Ser/Thr protein kinase) n=1 Tax=Kutzneria kofuensis TaxID=103725 RepID=A0A7W9NKY0_9PSEU|nr:sensor histidine kinase [Kutzneria kofuensis]MBB5896184.1 anti-sigma regulatory factor (Ser/Thr protein kinase) [Kutzneria kofuensis]